MPTIKDVAKRAGVSPVTVSRVINDASHVSQDTRSKVEQAIAELDYVPNVAARHMGMDSRELAAIVPQIGLKRRAGGNTGP